MVDMSHYDHVENLARTKALTEFCHGRGVAVEAESGRINGGEEGIADTGSLEGKQRQDQNTLYTKTATPRKGTPD